MYLRRLAAGSVLVDIELPRLQSKLAAGTITVDYHAMEWGDDPSHKLSDPLPGYWRELDATGNPLPAGGEMALSQGAAGAAASIAERRFRTAQTTKP